MKQIIITISMLSIGLALVIGVMVPIFTHSKIIGDTAVLRGQTEITRMGQVIR